jgi:hypothetical protein
MFIKREHLLDYMLKGYLHLSKKDYGFFNNLQYIVKDKQKVTSNQNKLFDKLIVKYQRQLKKLGHDIGSLQELSWAVELVPTSEEYLTAQIGIENDSIVFRSPFNTQFIQEFRKVDDNPFNWIKDTRYYKAPYSTYALKVLVDTVHKHYELVTYCDTLKKLLDEAKQYETSIWEPTLKKVKGNYIIAGINKSLYEATKDIVLDNQAKTLQTLSTYGIKIDTSVTQGDPFLEFAGNFEYTINIDELDKLCEWLEKLGLDKVVTNRVVIYNRQVNTEIRNKLAERNLKILSNDDSSDSRVVLLRAGFMNTFFASYDSYNIVKLINLVNTRPVQVK